MQSTPLRALRSSAFDYWKANHLLARAGFGGTPAHVRAVANMGLDKAVDYLVDYEKIESEPIRADTFDRDTVRPMNEENRREVREARQRGDEALLERFRMEVQRRQREDRTQMRAIQEWWMRRMIETPRPLEEKLTLFWHGHFATNYRGTEDSYHMFMQNMLFRRSASANFADLVFGIIRDPAMLRYLNNNQNRRRAPNENLARELMELFTLGEGNVYTENDIKEGARALTGYTFEDDSFVFRDDLHDPGVKRIFGQTGQFNGDDFARLILAQRVVSEFICHKLYRFFVNDVPGDPDREGQRFVLALAKMLRDTNYNIKPVLKAMFKSDHFYSDANTAAIIKNPIQLIVQTIRSLRAPQRNPRALLEASSLMGQNLFYPPSVKGWDGGRAWINTSTLFVRQNIIIYLLTGRRANAFPWQADGAPFDAMHLIEDMRSPGGSVDVEAVVMYLLRFTLGCEPHEDRIATLVDFINSHGRREKLNNNMLIAVLSLIAAMPEYQLC